MAENTKGAHAKSQEKKDPELSAGELRDQLKTFESKILEIEDRVRIIAELKSENETFKTRLTRLQRALYGMLFYAVHPGDTTLTEKHLNIMIQDLETLAEE